MNTEHSKVFPDGSPDVPLLEIQGISCNYGLERAVYDLSLTVNKGDQVCLLGPSGCGKTTVLRAVAGFQPLLSGSISINGQSVSQPGEILSPEKRRVGMVFQDHALFPHLSVEQNVGSGLRIFSAAERRATVSEVLERVGLMRVAQRFPHELSGGQQQRVALARALAPKPLLLLMDEPFSSLDLDLRERMGQEVADMLKANGITCILVTHDQNDAFAMGDKVGVMADGRLVQWDTAYNLYHEPGTRFVADFIGNGIFLPAEVKSPRVVDSEFGELSGDQDIVMPLGSQVEVLIRPDDVVLDVDSSVRGRVVRKAFKGAEILYTIRFGTGTTVLALFPSHANFEVGDDIGIRLEVDHLVTFAIGTASTDSVQ